MIFYSFAKKILFKLIQGMKKKTKWKNSEKYESIKIFSWYLYLDIYIYINLLFLINILIFVSRTIY